MAQPFGSAGLFEKLGRSSVHSFFFSFLFFFFICLGFRGRGHAALWLRKGGGKICSEFGGNRHKKKKKKKKDTGGSERASTGTKKKIEKKNKKILTRDGRRYIHYTSRTYIRTYVHTYLPTYIIFICRVGRYLGSYVRLPDGRLSTYLTTAEETPVRGNVRSCGCISVPLGACISTHICRVYLCME